MKSESSRNLLGYFLESKIWKKHIEDIVENPVFWDNIDPERAIRMRQAKFRKRKGYTVSEVIFDMIDCVYNSPLKESTKDRLLIEIDALEKFHTKEGTFESEL